jgi:hypothetical protein
MAVRNPSSKNSALKQTPKTLKTTPTREALIFRKLEKEMMKLGHLSFAREAERLCLTARYLRAGGFRTEAKVFSEKAEMKAVYAQTCEQTEEQLAKYRKKQAAK